MNTKTKEALTSKALNKRGGASKSILYLDWRLPMEILTKKELSHTLWGNIKKERGKTDSKIIRKNEEADNKNLPIINKGKSFVFYFNGSVFLTVSI